MFFFFNDTATTEIYTLSLHDALPICEPPFDWEDEVTWAPALHNVGSVYISYYPDLAVPGSVEAVRTFAEPRSEEHTSELQSRQYLVCRLLLEKKKNNIVLLLSIDSQ